MRPLIFHPYIQRDVDDALKHYRKISPLLEERFWNEFCRALEKIQEVPEKHHVDQFTGYKRFNLATFPYNILYINYPNQIRVQVLRHNKKRETFGSYRRKN